MSTALRSLSDSEILTRTSALVSRERAITLDLLMHLGEVERRKLFLELGHSSMFDYLVIGFRYSTSAAKRRLCASRCIAEYPRALDLLKANEINLSTILQVSKLLKPETGAEILERICGKSQREVEAIVAEHEPLEALPRDRARTVVVRVPATAEIAAKPTEASDRRVGDTSRSPGATVSLPEVQDRNGPKVASPSQPPMTFERRAIVQFSAREEVMNKLARVRSLASHRLPMNAPLEQLIEFLTDYFTEREDPNARHERREARSNAKPANPPKHSSARAIPARVRDEVFVRDQGECRYVGPDGRRCGSRHVVQIDHIKPVARGGSASIDNLRLLCAYHNRLECARLMGREGPPA